MNRLDGKVALVSGAARGIGAETARKMAAAGASVVVGERNKTAGHERSLICKGSHASPLIREQGVGSSNLPAWTNKIKALDRRRTSRGRERGRKPLIGLPRPLPDRSICF